LSLAAAREASKKMEHGRPRPCPDPGRRTRIARNDAPCDVDLPMRAFSRGVGGGGSAKAGAAQRIDAATSAKDFKLEWRNGGSSAATRSAAESAA